MKKLLIPFITLLSLITNCDKENPATPEYPEEKPLVEALMGPEGGDISTESFLISVPSGAFEQSQNIKIYLFQNEDLFPTNKNTNIYKVQGVPSNFSKPLKLKIKYNQDLEGYSCVVIGSEEYIEELGEDKLMFKYSDAVDSSGYLCGEILPYEDEGNVSQRTKMLKVSDSKSIVEWIIMGLSRRGTHKSKCSEINYDATLDNSKVILLGQFIDGIVNYFQSKKITTENDFTSQGSLKIVVRDDNETKANIYFNSPQDIGLIPLDARFGKLIANFWVNINEVYYKGATEDDLREIAAETVYRFVRTRWLGIERNWFDWATIYWVKHEFRYDNKKWEEAFSKTKVFMQPFKGIGSEEISAQSGLETWDLDLGNIKYRLEVCGEGVGMSPFIKYIMDTYDSDGLFLMKYILAAIDKNDYLPTDILIDILPEPENIWWPNFFKEYISGKIFNISSNVFINNIPNDEQANFTNIADTLKIFERSYRDLSAKLCRINLSEQFKEEGTIKFKLGPTSLNLNYVKVLVFGLKGYELIFLDEGIDFSLSGIKEYDALIACIVNSGNEPPYIGTSKICLEVRAKVEDWKWLKVLIVIRNIDADVERYSPHYNTYDTIKWLNMTHSHQPYKVNKVGYYFTGVKDSIYDWGTYQSHEMGNIFISMDPSNYNVTTFSLEDSTSYELNSVSYKVEGFYVPLHWIGETGANHLLETNVSSHITKLEWNRVENAGFTYERRYRLLKIVGDSNATIEITWSEISP